MYIFDTYIWSSLSAHLTIISPFHVSGPGKVRFIDSTIVDAPIYHLCVFVNGSGNADGAKLRVFCHHCSSVSLVSRR